MGTSMGQRLMAEPTVTARSLACLWGLAPSVETLPTSGKVGATVKILGTNLAGTTCVVKGRQGASRGDPEDCPVTVDPSDLHYPA
jgi:hypothetical protein